MAKKKARKMEKIADLLTEAADDIDSCLIEADDEDWEGHHDAAKCKKIAARLRKLADKLEHLR